MLIKIICGLVYFYQALSKFTKPVCRLTPSCSNYFLEAIKLHGLKKGTLLAGRRIFNCHPWGKSGYDPVPRLENQP